ncbi:unnamed protein product, partial [Brassica rapa]
MKKKKPKKSPARSSPTKSSPKTPSPAKSSPNPSNSSPDTEDTTIVDPKNGSDAQFDFTVDEVAHHSSDPVDLFPKELVIVAPSTDPSLLCDKTATGMVTESSLVAPLVISGVETEGPETTPLITSELSSIAPQVTSEMDTESPSAFKDLGVNIETAILATAEAKTGSLSMPVATVLTKPTGDPQSYDSGSKAPQDEIVPPTLEANQNPVASKSPVENSTCSVCNSLSHVSSKCPQKPQREIPKKKTRRGRSKDKQQQQQQQWQVVNTQHTVEQNHIIAPPAHGKGDQVQIVTANDSKLGTHSDKVRGETSGSALYLQSRKPRNGSGDSRHSGSDVQPDSSDVESSDSELEE